MRREQVWVVGRAGALAWLFVAAFGVRSAFVDEGEDWELPYVLFSVALLAAGILTVVMAGSQSRESTRPRLRVGGLLACGLGVALSFVAAWAVVAWAALLGTGLGLIAFARLPDRRGTFLVLAAGPLLGIAVTIAGIVGEVGRQDEHLDYPVPAGVGLAVVALVTAVGLIRLMRQPSTVPA